MKLKIFLFVIAANFLWAQSLPINFDLGSNRAAKFNDKTPVSNSIEKIIISQNTIWIATSNGLSKSTDNGESWTNYYKSPDFGEEGISAIGYYDGVIWAATWHFEEVFGEARPFGSGLRYSMDEGNTWNEVAQPVDAPDDTVEFYGNNRIKVLPITNSDQNYIRQIAFTNNTIWIATSAGGLRKSSDMGKTWKRVVVPPDNLNSISPNDTVNFYLGPANKQNGNLNHIGYSILTVNDSVLYYGSYGGGINKTTDGGKSWVKFTNENQDNPISGTQIMDIAYNEYDSSIWAATWKFAAAGEYSAISFSYDGGNSWSTTLIDSKALDVNFKYYGNQDSYTDSDVFAATNDGLFRSINDGQTWIAAPKILDSKTKIAVKSREFRAVAPNKRENNSYDIWIGSLDGLVRLNETASNWSGDWKVFLAAKATENPSETFAFPNPFSPSNEITRIKYSLLNSESVTIRIFDFGMNLVRTVIQNASRGANDNQIEIWDGKDEGGGYVPNGVYFYRIDIGSNEPLFGKIMVLM